MDAPLLTVFAGPNGSGKSTLTRHLTSAGYDFGDYINPDDIAATLAGTYERRVREAQTLADTRRAEAIAKRSSFSFETVFSHPSKLDVLDQAREAGFDVSLFFIATDDPAINVERVSTRTLTGGHDVPSDRVIARYARVMALVPTMLERVDRAWDIRQFGALNETVCVFGPPCRQCGTQRRQADCDPALSFARLDGAISARSSACALRSHCHVTSEARALPYITFPSFINP